jgi:hypothetical protein
MDFGRRLKLFLFGLIIGGALAWLFFGQRLLNAGWTPSARIKKRIDATLIRASADAQRSMAAWPTDLRSVRAAVSEAEVILKETRRSGDSIFYTLDATVAGKAARSIVLVMEHYERDSTATLLSLTPR